MLKMKHLHIFVIKSFLGPLAVTFFICLFIFLLQSVWKYIDILVGKGLDFATLSEFFFYLTLTVFPMALPLAILLAALMAFGNMGEHLELLSMKAAGVSLFRIMNPLIFFIVFVCIGAFFFSNEVLPWSRNKMYSMKENITQKKPELEISENKFVQMGDDFVVKVQRKDKETGTLYGLIFYDHSKGKTYENITYADSAKMKMTADDGYMHFTMYHGVRMDFFKESNRKKYDTERAPFQKEYFTQREMMMPLDRDLKDDLMYSNHYISLSVRQLRAEADSINKALERIEVAHERVLQRRYSLAELPNDDDELVASERARSIQAEKETRLDERSSPVVDTLRVEAKDPTYLFYSLKKEELSQALSKTLASIRSYREQSEEYQRRTKAQGDLLRRVISEWHRKFSLSFSCLIFFFIGAPLGAIIRKGGLGLPVVISVLLFVIYYVLDTVGVTMSREGTVPAYIGMWLSSFFLLPLGIFLTIQAATDSVIMNTDTYKKFFSKLFKRDKHNDK